MMFSERALSFDCQGHLLPGILALPAQHRDIAVVVVVGGPQYRVGSHRQFVLLARALANAGYPVLRFDTRGMGDASGEFPGFEHIGPDIAGAIDALHAEVPGLAKVVVWGLCDAASAILINQELIDSVAGMVLLNPWVRNADTLATAEVKHYYHKRLLDPAFWTKLLRGKVDILASLREFLGKVFRLFSRRQRGDAPSSDFRERMVQGWLRFERPVLLILSGIDMVAAEFSEFARAHRVLAGVLDRPTVTRIEFAEADHTFSSAAHRAAVEAATLDWLEKLSDGDA